MGDTAAAGSGDVRIFRVVEGAGDRQATAEFRVPVAFLTASEVLGVLTPSNTDGIMISEDNVIPFRDSIKSIEALVGWMTRKKGFEINDENMRDLATLADKYIIEALSKDLQYYTERYISRNQNPTFDLWEFAARFAMIDLEGYCRANTTVFSEIRSILADPTKGLQYFLKERQIPVSVMNKVITGMAQEQRNNDGGGKHCSRCYRMTASRCTGCGQIY